MSRWTCDKNYVTDFPFTVRDADGWSIAHITGFEGDPRAAKHAALITAAPALRDALEAFLRAPSLGSNRPGSLTIEVQEFNIRAAQKALAKAKIEGGGSRIGKTLAMCQALQATLPLLIRLGDFIGNAEGRCETILAVRAALADEEVQS